MFEHSFVRHGINNLIDLKGSGTRYQLLSITFVICLFSMSGIPPLVGFYAKLEVLRSCVIESQSMIYLIAIVCSVISASYYLKIIKVMMFDTPSVTLSTGTASLTSGTTTGQDYFSQHKHEVFVMPYCMTFLIVFTSLFILDSNLIINSTELVAISYFTT